MDKSNLALIIEARTIIYVLYSILQESPGTGQDVSRQDISRLVNLARMRLDALSCNGCDNEGEREKE